MTEAIPTAWTRTRHDHVFGATEDIIRSWNVGRDIISSQVARQEWANVDLAGSEEQIQCGG